MIFDKEFLHLFYAVLIASLTARLESRVFLGGGTSDLNFQELGVSSTCLEGIVDLLALFLLLLLLLSLAFCVSAFGTFVG
jgi:hypothetical protein